MRVGVFVDAGYFFAEGGRLLTGSKQRRERLALNIDEAREKLRLMASTCCDLRLLRIYWYDGIRLGRLTPEHSRLAHSDDIKMRLGQINAAGKQKGVDALIITDLAELARNKAISDAVLLAGDEDLRVGVLLAQQFGVRVHLLGIHPSGDNQSLSLRQECDTTTEWDQDTVSTMLTRTDEISTIADGPDGALIDRISNYVCSLGEDVGEVLKHHVTMTSAIPADYDRDLLRLGRQYHDRQTLTEAERTTLRKLFIDAVSGRS